MPISINLSLQKLKYIATETPAPQITLYILSKLCISIVQLPHQEKESTQIPLLLTTILLLCLSIVLKFIRHKFLLIRCLLGIQMKCFLLWIVTIIMNIFTWSLLHAVGWAIFQRIAVVVQIVLAVFVVTLMMKEEFITKMEFFVYEAVLGVQIVAVSLKTVGFIKYNTESPHKDIVLLNLTTQIALAIILMDYLEQSYARKKASEVKDDMQRLENEMIFVSKPLDTIRNSEALRENLEFKDGGL